MSAVDRDKEVYFAVLRVLRERRPDLFEEGKPWEPGGVAELQQQIPGLIDAANELAANPRIGLPVLVDQHVCTQCQHMTPCGYCVHRNQSVCVVEQEAPAVFDAVQKALQRMEHVKHA